MLFNMIITTENINIRQNSFLLTSAIYYVRTVHLCRKLWLSFNFAKMNLPRTIEIQFIRNLPVKS